MAVYRIADINMKINPESLYTKNLLCNYIVNTENFDVEISITKNDIEFEVEISNGVAYDICEATAIFRKICNLLLYDFNGIFLHSATIIYKGRAYAFVAPSGTGKTTHIMLWKRLFKDKIKILNGDKLLMRIQNKKIIAYGNPWQGKENLGENSSCELGGIYILRRSQKNFVENISPYKALENLINSTIFPKDVEGKNKVIDFFEKIIEKIDVCILNCNMETDAVYTALLRIEKGD
ncbi:MAG: hypothetical protein U0M12_09045 [Acutalibacteraceae bacterium]|nr:hypothetical protein [Acutalibacteraceae bacterium]